MAAGPRSKFRKRRTRGGAALSALLAGVVGVTWSSAACAYIGDSFLQIPGASGHWPGRDHKGWIRAEASQWKGRLRMLNSGSSDPLAGDKLYFGGPNAPKPGNFGTLILMVSKDSKDLPQLMQLCHQKTTLPELTYVESSQRARPVLELGPRPAKLPAFWEYRLKNAQVSDCPVLEGAADQAVAISFKDIEWLNYDPKQPSANKIVIDAKDLPKVRPVEATAKKQVRSYLITWIAPATLARDDQCPAMNAKPTDAEVYKYLSPEEAALVRAKAGDKGITAGTLSEMRGPHRLDVVLLPAIVPDPGLHEPQTTVADGLNLDGDDGSGAPPRGVRKHKNYVSPDGRTGIDNQLLLVTGCIPGHQGKKGYGNQTSNARRGDGNITTLVQISGIDDETNDKDVDVSIIYSMDKPVRDSANAKFIADYTFRPATDPNFALYNVRVHGRIVNGVVLTDEVPEFRANLGQNPELTVYKARMRFAPQPDGSVKGVLAGYLDWRVYAEGFASGYSEGLFGYQAPGVYYALKRNADGLQDPATGEFNGISAAFEIDTVPAFLTPAAPDTVKVAQDKTTGGKSQ